MISETEARRRLVELLKTGWAVLVDYGERYRAVFHGSMCNSVIDIQGAAVSRMKEGERLLVQEDGAATEIQRLGSVNGRDVYGEPLFVRGAFAIPPRFDFSAIDAPK